MLLDYLPVFLMVAFGLAFALGTGILSYVVGPRKESSSKNDTYECGMPPVGNARERFNVKFFLVAMVFVIFDIEVVFVFLWAVVFQQLGLYGILVMGIFLALLVLSLIYEVKKGVLEWASKTKSSI